MARVVVVGDVHTVRGRRDEVVALLRETAEQVRREAGCERYDFAEAVGEPGRFLTVQEWRDEAALRAHYLSEPFSRYQARVGELLSRPSEVRIHAVAGTVRPEDPGPMDPALAD